MIEALLISFMVVKAAVIAAALVGAYLAVRGT